MGLYGPKRNRHRREQETLGKLGLDQILKSIIAPAASSQHGAISNVTAPSTLGQLPTSTIPTLTLTDKNSERGTVNYPRQDEPQWSQDVSRQPSLNSLSRYARDGDMISILSTPQFSLTSIDGEIERVIRLANSFFSQGELENAELLFRQGLTLLDTETKQIERIQFRTQIAVIWLYRGKYEDAKKELNEIKDSSFSPINQTSAERIQIQNELERWFATSLLLHGQYKEAAEAFKGLLHVRESVDKNSSQAEAPDFQIRRDLALAYGHLGEHSEAQRLIKEADELFRASMGAHRLPKYRHPLPRNMSSSSLGLKVGPQHAKKEGAEIEEVPPKGFSILFASAVLDMLLGEYEPALKKSQQALKGRLDHLGKKNIKSLESASLNATLLAYSSQYSQAEKLCIETLKIMTNQLGQKHPLSLETMGCLVYIFRAQSRFAEARDTARSLCKYTKAALGESHPQTLRARSLLSGAYFRLGEYQTSEREFREVVKLSEERLGSENPDTLYYATELARVLSYCGKVNDAELMALDVIQKQTRLYSLSPKSKNPKQTSTKSLNEILSDIRENKKKFRVHLDLILTLQVLAIIEMHKPQADIDLAQLILETVVDRRTKKLGSSHALTLISQYELASVRRENARNGQDLANASKALRQVWQGRVELFGGSRPDTLSAERELVITECVRGSWELGGPAKKSGDSLRSYPSSGDQLGADTQPHLDRKGGESGNPSDLSINDWEDVANISQQICQQQEPQLGPTHPETLKSYLWLFTVQMVLRRPDKADSISKLLLERLRSPSVRKERLVSALRAEEKIALMFADQGHHDKAIGILHQILSAVNELQEHIDESLKSSLTSLREDALEEIEQWKPEIDIHIERLRDLSKQGAAQYAAEDFIGAENTRVEVYDRSRCLLGISHSQTLLEMFDLASTKWAIGNIEKQRDAIRIVSQLADQLRLTDDLQLDQLKKEVSEKQKLWVEQLYLFEDEAAKKEHQTYDMLAQETSSGLGVISGVTR